MPGLMLDLRYGERLLVNGGLLEMVRPTRIRLCTQVRFAFGRQLLDEEHATTPARRFARAVQHAYAGTEVPNDHAAIAAAAAVSGGIAGADEVLRLLSAGDGATAFRLARQIVRAENDEEHPA